MLKADILHRRHIAGRSGIKPAALIELIVIWQISLGNDAQRTVAQHYRAIVQLTVDRHRRSDHQRQIACLGAHSQVGYGSIGSLQQVAVMKKVGTGVSGYAQFGHHHQVDTRHLAANGRQQRFNSLKIRRRIGRSHGWHSGHRSEISIIHRFINFDTAKLRTSMLIKAKIDKKCVAIQ
jgi:hypothetical protein